MGLIVVPWDETRIELGLGCFNFTTMNSLLSPSELLFWNCNLISIGGSDSNVIL